MTEEQRNVIIKCRNSGLEYATIAKDIGLTKDAVVAFCRRNGLTGNMAGKAEYCKWGIRKRFQSGEIGTANKHLPGYRYDEAQKKYTIIPEEAKAVRWMFQMYIDGVSLRGIAKNINQTGIRSVLGNEFKESTVRQLIFNEIYVGDIRRQKCFMEDPTTKNKVKNEGQLPQYYIEDCHEAIIDRGTWTMLQAEIERRAASLNPVYPFTGKIKCGICDRRFGRAVSQTADGGHHYWYCRAKSSHGVTCDSVNSPDSDICKIPAYLMGMEEFDGAGFEEQVKELVALEDRRLECHFQEGKVRKWQRT